MHVTFIRLFTAQEGDLVQTTTHIQGPLI